MWLDRSFERNDKATTKGHVGELWMVHGGGFYKVEKLLMGPTKVPQTLHWFKWESYWTWISGFTLVCLIFYTGEGTFLLDPGVSNLTYPQGVSLSLFTIFGSWFFYDFLWERTLTRDKPTIGHILTLTWFVGMTYLLCHTLSGRAAYLHIGAMLGTWMTANVFMRIIPRQVKMVEASKNGEPVNQNWGKNAKNRSTHNTYFTLPVIFIMLSNHFPSTYGHELAWVILLCISVAGAAIREYFIKRESAPQKAQTFGYIGLLFLGITITLSVSELKEYPSHNHEHHDHSHEHAEGDPIGDVINVIETEDLPKIEVKGVVHFEGKVPRGKELRLPTACAKQFDGPVYSNEIQVSNGKLANVLISIVKGHEALPKEEAPSEAIEIDQRGCIYRPRLTTVRVGQEVIFINSDSIFHNVKSVTKKNKSFNLAMPKKDQRISRVFKFPEIFLQTKCSVHPWMLANIAIMDHPYYDKSNAKGEYSIKNIVPGKYTIRAWHENLGTQEKEIEITKDFEEDIEFTFTPKE